MTKGIKYFLLAFGLSIFVFAEMNFFQKDLESFLYAQISAPLQLLETPIARFHQKELPPKPALELVANAALSLEIDKQGKETTLFEFNKDKVMPIASLSKLMAALVVMEDEKDYNFSKVVTVSKTAAEQMDVPDYGNLKAGELENVENLLGLMLVFSSNDAVYALSEVVGPENFVAKMNEKAASLGMTNTHFINPTGLDPAEMVFSEENKDSFNHSTARDTATLAKYILGEIPLIFEISAGGKPYYQVYNKFADFFPEQKVVGLKTGYTDQAGGCLVLVFVQDDNYFINVILGTKDKDSRISEMKKLIEWVKQ